MNILHPLLAILQFSFGIGMSTGRILGGFLITRTRTGLPNLKPEPEPGPANPNPKQMLLFTIFENILHKI